MIGGSRLCQTSGMRPRIIALAVTGLAAAAALASSAPAQAPAQAGAQAAVAAGDLGTIGRAAVEDGGREGATGSASRSGLEILQGRASVRASRKGGDASAAATAIAEGVTLFGGLVTAERVTQTATTDGAGVSVSGAVTGLVVNGVARGDRSGAASWSAGGARVSVNRDGAGLTVRLTRAVAGFASGTTVRIAEVRAEAVDGADPAATPTPQATPTATPDPIDPGGGDDDTGGGDKPAKRAKPKVDPEERLARGGFVFPVYGDVRCADDFGAARQIGAHQGNDCFAAFGSPVLAVADGTLNRVGTLPISGNRLWLKTKRGDAFFYAHLSAFAPDAVSGRKVKAGTLLGFVGNTGDAEPTPPHVHFEIHPGDKAAIDPHTILGAWQDRGEVPTGGWLARYGTDTEDRPGALVEVRDFIAGE